MKYQYKFSTGYVEVEVDPKWVALLKEFDRQESNSNRKQRRYTAEYYDGLEFVPEYMGEEDKNISQFFDGSLAFEYAVSHLLPKHREILIRRALLGEKWIDIERALGENVSATPSYYKKICSRFCKFYKEGLWLNSPDNVDTPHAPKIKSIPYGLSPSQVMAIRDYRCQFKSQIEIAELMGIPLNRIKRCLRENPILETICPGCGGIVTQTGYGRMQIFCSDRCYYNWFHAHGLDASVELKTTQGKEYLTLSQRIVVDYYRQLFIPLAQIQMMMKISRQVLSAHCCSNPLPYTSCLNCGARIFGTSGKRPLKYCSYHCCNVYHGKLKKLQKQTGNRSPQAAIPTPEQLCYAAELRFAGYGYTHIEEMTGLTLQDLVVLFRFLDEHEAEE